MSRDRTTTRRVILSGAGAAGLSLLGLQKSSAQEEKAKADHAGHIPELNLSEPVVFINGPFPYLLREAKVGQLIQVQVSYPISPPFPKSVKVDLSSRALSLVGVYRTVGEVAILTLKPKQGKLGVGFLSIFVKAMNAGNATITAKITLAEGTVKEVPFTFKIDA